MNVLLVKRDKIVHVGFKARVFGETETFSLYNQRMDSKDTITIGEESEVTCKRCLKKMGKADENGRVTL